MKAKNSNIGAIILLMLLISGCIQNNGNTTNTSYKAEPTNFTTYRDTNFNFSIEYPYGWEIVQNTKSKTSFILPKEYEGGYITLNMQILLSIDSGGTYKLTDNVISDLIQQLREKTKNLRINYERESMLGDSNGKEISVSYTLNDINYTQTQVIAKVDNYFYSFTYLSPSEHYEEYTHAYMRSKNSFNHMHSARMN